MIDSKYLDSRVYGSRRTPPEEIDPNAWDRELRTAKEIMKRFKKQPGVLLADDTGLGKTWVAALTAMAIAKRGGRVLVLVPNKTMLGKWEKDLYTVRSLLWDDSEVRIRVLKLPAQRLTAPAQRRLRENNIALATHHQFSQNNFPNVTADLLIVDEAHRSKGDGSMFRERLEKKRKNFQGFLFLTATPFSIAIRELISIIEFVSDNKDEERKLAIKNFDKFALEAQRGDCQRSISEAEECWKAAVDNLKPWVIRHTIDGLDSDEKKSFGNWKEWTIEVPPADEKTVEILIRTDRLLNLQGGPKEINGFRGSDPRFHVGWQYLRHLITDDLRKTNSQNKIGEHHIWEIRKKLKKVKQHPKVKAVVDEVARRVEEDREKVVVFCHHIATMHEVADALSCHRQLKKSADPLKRSCKDFLTWSGAWNSLLEANPYLKNKDDLRKAVLKWVASPAFRRQVVSWLSSEPETEHDWKEALKKTPVRGMMGKEVPTILQAVLELAHLYRHSVSSAENVEDEEETIPVIFSHTRWDSVTTAQSDDLDAQLALFNTPFGPDVLVATDRLSEGIDLHKCCRLLVHYEFDPSPVRIRQREGRIRRIKGWAQRIGEPIEYAYPTFANTRDELLVQIVKDRLKRFDLLLGGASSVDISNIDHEACRTPDTNLLELLEKRIGNNAKKCLTITNRK